MLKKDQIKKKIFVTFLTLFIKILIYKNIVILNLRRKN